MDNETGLLPPIISQEEGQSAASDGGSTEQTLSDLDVVEFKDGGTPSRGMSLVLGDSEQSSGNPSNSNNKRKGAEYKEMSTHASSQNSHKVPRYSCLFKDCERLYLSTCAVRKHAARNHSFWLKEVDDEYKNNGVKGQKTSSYCKLRSS